jgi:hypothetical protein
MTHSHFLQMGGFVLCKKGGKPLWTLSFHEFKSNLQDKRIAFPLISKEEIMDKSKADTLAKAIALLQTSWFVAQCIARAFQRVALTELELTTLALAALNFAMYFLWWDKPFDVGSPVMIYILDGDGESMQPTEDEGRASALTAGPPGKQIKGWLNTLLNGLFIWPVYKELTSLMDCNEIGSRPRRVPTFFAHYFFGTSIGDHLVCMVTAGAGSIFGAIHLIAWSFDFPSRPEQIIWRTAACIVTGTPIVMGVLGLILTAYKENNMIWVLTTICGVISRICILLYMPARLYLIVESVISFRALPLTAYETVQWTLHFPHIS